MRVKIISQGSPDNTKLINAETGEEIENVVGIQWISDGLFRFCRADIKIKDVPVEVEGQMICSICHDQLVDGNFAIIGGDPLCIQCQKKKSLGPRD